MGTRSFGAAGLAGHGDPQDEVYGLYACCARGGTGACRAMGLEPIGRFRDSGS